MRVISAVNASARKAFSLTSNAFLEVQWYLFAAVFLLAAGYTLLDPAGNVVTLPGNADTVAISWSMTPGIYKLSTIQHSLTTNCDGLLEIGDILVRDQAVPTFAPVGPFCMNSTPSLLPGISTNGITGSWMPAIISTGTVGTSTYTFTPDAGQCAVVVNLVIETTDQLIDLRSSQDLLGRRGMVHARAGLPAHRPNSGRGELPRLHLVGDGGQRGSGRRGAQEPGVAAPGLRLRPPAYELALV